VIPIRDNIPSRRAPVVTWSLITINAVIFFYEVTLAPEQLERLFTLFGLVPARYTHPEWATWIGFPIDDCWPFLTSMFLHGSWLHIIGNMWTLWIFGDNVEDRMGPWRFLSFYLLMGLAAGLTHWFTNLDSTVPTVGASGAIAGVLGAYFVLFPRARIIVLLPILFWPFFFELPAILYLMFWFFSQIVSGTMAGLGPSDVGGIAWWAHVGGFVSGALLYRLFVPPARSSPRRLDRDEYGIEGAWTALPLRQETLPKG
jgi:membrane associated rhomboid family serine protease